MASGLHAYAKGRNYAEVANWVSAAWNAIEQSTIIFGFWKAEIIPSSLDAVAEIELSDGEENSFELNDEIFELFQSASESSDFEGF